MNQMISQTREAETEWNPVAKKKVMHLGTENWFSARDSSTENNQGSQQKTTKEEMGLGVLVAYKITMTCQAWLQRSNSVPDCIMRGIWTTDEKSLCVQSTGEGTSGMLYPIWVWKDAFKL